MNRTVLLAAPLTLVLSGCLTDTARDYDVAQHAPCIGVGTALGAAGGLVASQLVGIPMGWGAALGALAGGGTGAAVGCEDEPEASPTPEPAAAEAPPPPPDKPVQLVKRPTPIVREELP